MTAGKDRHPSTKETMHLTLDWETRSRVDLKSAGVYPYAADPSTDILCAAVMVDGQRPVLWVNDGAFSWNKQRARLAAELPLIPTAELLRLLAEADEIESHNAQFERVVHQGVGVGKYGWPEIPLEKWRCSAAKAAMHALPRGLGDAADALRIGVSKDWGGYQVMMKFCKPRKATKADASEWYENTDDFIKLCKYCMQDTITEHALSTKLHDLPDDELRLWQLDQRINDRGVFIDIDTARSMVAMAEEWKAQLLKEFKVCTNYKVESPTQVEKFLCWLEENGLPLDDLRKQRLVEVLKDDDLAQQDPFADDAEKLAPNVRRALVIRTSISKASVKKYDAMLRCACADQRARGLLLYHGASTGRWTGKLIQVQNFPRGSMEFEDVLRAIDAVGTGGAGLVSLLWDDPMAVASSCLRATMRAAPGHELIVADYSAIEGRLLAWLAGEESVLKAYAEGLDLYKVAASVVYGIPYEQVTKPQRQIGKVIDLACIAEGTLVLTEQGEIPIESVPAGVRVWDGIDWVKQEGSVYRGTKEVLTYDGLTATADHLVWIEGQEGPVEFGLAASRGERLLTTGLGGRPIRVGGDHQPGGQVPEAELATVHGADPVHGLRVHAVDVPGQPDAGEDQGVPSLQPAQEVAPVAGPQAHRSEGPLHEPGEYVLAELRSEGHNLRLPVSVRGLRVGDGEPGTVQVGEPGPDRQLQRLRAGEPALGYTPGAEHEPAQLAGPSGGPGLGGEGQPVQPGDDGQHAAAGADAGADNREGAASRAREAEELGPHPVQTRRVRVFDLLNCGPRNRFTAAGKLVHNCGYQGWVGAFHSMAANYGVKVSDEEASKAIGAWREGRPATVALWHGLEQAALAAVRAPGSMFAFGKIRFKVKGSFLRMQLPSGRVLFYPHPRIEIRTDKYGREKAVVLYEGQDTKAGSPSYGKWTTLNGYGGRWTENAVQALARDIMRQGMFNADSAGYPAIFSVHDELVTEVPTGWGDVAQFENLLCTLPPWAEGLPLKATGYRSVRYKKD